MKSQDLEEWVAEAVPLCSWPECLEPRLGSYTLCVGHQSIRDIRLQPMTPARQPWSCTAEQTAEHFQYPHARATWANLGLRGWCDEHAAEYLGCTLAELAIFAREKLEKQQKAKP